MTSPAVGFDGRLIFPNTVSPAVMPRPRTGGPGPVPGGGPRAPRTGGGYPPVSQAGWNALANTYGNRSGGGAFSAYSPSPRGAGGPLQGRAMQGGDSADAYAQFFKNNQNQAPPPRMADDSGYRNPQPPGRAQPIQPPSQGMPYGSGQNDIPPISVWEPQNNGRQSSGAAQPIQQPSQGTAYNPMGNLAYAPSDQRPPAFQANVTNWMGQPTTIGQNANQQAAMVQAINQWKAPYAADFGQYGTPIPQVPIAQLAQQANDMVRGGWTNPFMPGQAQPTQPPSQGTPYGQPWGDALPTQQSMVQWFPGARDMRASIPDALKINSASPVQQAPQMWGGRYGVNGTGPVNNTSPVAMPRLSDIQSPPRPTPFVSPPDYMEAHPDVLNWPNAPNGGGGLVNRNEWMRKNDVLYPPAPNSGGGFVRDEGDGFVYRPQSDLQIATSGKRVAQTESDLVRLGSQPYSKEFEALSAEDKARAWSAYTDAAESSASQSRQAHYNSPLGKSQLANAQDAAKQAAQMRDLETEMAALERYSGNLPWGSKDRDDAALRKQQISAQLASMHGKQYSPYGGFTQRAYEPADQLPVNPNTYFNSVLGSRTVRSPNDYARRLSGTFTGRKVGGPTQANGFGDRII